MLPLIITVISLCAALAAFITYIVVRAVIFVPAKIDREKTEPLFIDGDRAVKSLSEMIKCKTVSNRDKALEDNAEFKRFEELLRKLFPRVYEACRLEKVGDRGLLFKWQGRSRESPTVLMAHYDVVSANAENWERDPFGGEVDHGVIWGRGTIDTKGTLNGILCAAEALIRDQFVPKSDIYFAFAGDEEIAGHGASDIVKLFLARGITPGLVLDEGGAVVEGVFPGVKAPAALIGIAEKGMVNIEYSVKGGGGHASSPAPVTPIGRLSRACVRVEKRPFKYRMTKPTRLMFDTLGRHSTFMYRIIFANLSLFSPILSLMTKKQGGELNALVRTTTAFTQMEGSKGMNVIPPYAKMVSNHRIIAGESVDSVLLKVKKTVKDESVEVKAILGMDPSRISDTSSEAWSRLCLSITDTWQDTIVSPYTMVACSDSRHWGILSDKVYRFSPMALSNEERATIHGNNERIPLTTVARTVEFFVRFIKRC